MSESFSPTSSANPAAKLRRWAVATVVMALVTVVMGALVTSKRAGMAFRDWPTSDGSFILTYNWLGDLFRDDKKFLEHGHRLAGMAIGLMSVILAVKLVRQEPRRWMKFLGVLILCGVICQGLLGGVRVLRDDQRVAMFHGFFAACVFSLMGIAVTALGRRWRNPLGDVATCTEIDLDLAKPLAVGLVLLLSVQYLLGGQIRHHGSGLHEHLILGVVTFLAMIGNWLVARGSHSRWIQQSGSILAGFTLFQVLLGFGAWVTKWGFAPVGYVATVDSIDQVVVRTAHMVSGLGLFAMAVVHVVRVFRTGAVLQVTQVALPATHSAMEGAS